MYNTKENELIANAFGFQLTSLGWFDNEEILKLRTKNNTFNTLLFDKNKLWLNSVLFYIPDKTIKTFEDVVKFLIENPNFNPFNNN